MTILLLALALASQTENEFLKVERTGDKFQITDKATGRAVITDGELADAANTEITAPAKLPFVLFRRTLVTPGTVNQVPVLSAKVAVAGHLTTIGTGGLQAPEKNTGSYAWLAIADPQTRNGIVAAWLTHDRGSGVVFSPVTNGAVRIAAQIDYGRLWVKNATPTETFVLGYFADTRLGLEAYADAVAKHYNVKLPPQPAGFCTWYTEKHSRACDETNIMVLASYAAKELKPFGFDFVQIDDYWQDGVSTNGPKRNFMTAKPSGPYPSGMKATADNIKKLGLTPGIWFMPFAGTYYDPIFTPHQDWFYKGPDGKPFETRWGGTCLDMSVPGAREYLTQLVNRIAHEWGYKVFKMDGLWTGTGTRLMYVNNGYKWDEMGEAAPADPDKTQIENYRDGLKLIRQVAGPDVFLLGCCVSQNMRSFGGAFGLLDAMRIGPDTGSGHIGAPHASRNYFLNGRVWWNDPDCVSVRARTSLDQARVNASFTAITGTLFYNSDWMPDLPAERLEILKRTLATHHLQARPVDYFENDPARVWHLMDSGTGILPVNTLSSPNPTGRMPVPRRDIVALFNWGNSTRAIACSAERIGLPKAGEYAVFDFWSDKFLAPLRGGLKLTLPGHSCRVLAIRPAANHPQLLSTSRHITQGIMDVLEEKWDTATKTLSGTSRVVANDPYELRVVVPVGDNSWRALPPATQNGPNVRITITNATSADVKWQIKFERGAVGAAAPVVEAAAPPPVEPKRVPTPPAPSVYLDTLKPVSAQNGWGKLGINKSIGGSPLIVDGKKYEHGLGCHAHSLVVYKIPAGAKRFVAVVGLDDGKKDDERSSVCFEVYGDVKEMGEEPELLAKSPVLASGKTRSWAFNVELTERHKELRLVVIDAGDGIAADHADWVDTGFVMK